MITHIDSSQIMKIDSYLTKMDRIIELLETISYSNTEILSQLMVQNEK